MSRTERTHEKTTGDREIRRYANRKLYDPAERSFTSLRKIERLVRDGHRVRVVDHTSGENVTEQVLGRVLGSQVRDSRRQSNLPLADLIRLPGTAVRAAVAASHEAAEHERHGNEVPGHHTDPPTDERTDAEQTRGEIAELRQQVEELTKLVARLITADADHSGGAEDDGQEKQE